MKKFMVFLVSLLVAINLLSAEEVLRVSDVKSWEQVGNTRSLGLLLKEAGQKKNQVLVARVYGCYTRERQRELDLAQYRATLIADYLRLQPRVEVIFTGIEKGRRGIQAHIAYELRVEKNIIQTSGFGLLNLLDGTLERLGVEGQPSKTVVYFFLIFVAIILAIIILKIIFRQIKAGKQRWAISSKIRQAKKTDKKKYQAKEASLKAEMKHQQNLEAIRSQATKATERKRELDAEEARQEELRKKIQEAEEAKIKAELKRKQAEADLAEYEAKAKEKELVARKKADRDQQLQSLPIWPKSVEEIRALEQAGETDKDEERYCPHCLAGLQAQVTSGQISEEEMIKKIAFLPKVKFQNVLRHFGRCEKSGIKVLAMKPEATN